MADKLLRALTINFWGTEPVLDDRLALAGRQLRGLAPDVVGMQEVRPLDGRSGTTTADVLAAELGMRALYEPALEWADGAFFPGHPGGQEGLAVLSRWPIVDHRVTRLPDERPTERRILLSACIDLGVTTVWFHTTHLHWRLDDGAARERQVVAVDDVIRGLATDAPQILCGDFNATPAHDEVRFLLGQHTLAGRRTHYQDAYARIHPQAAGATWSAENEHTRKLRSLDVDRRIDYVFVTTRKKDGRGTIHAADLALQERDHHGRCASDHYAVYADVQVTADDADSV
jgi:endonuclease/exonuclease/phosphatase family metal-dependent hydrolase